MCIRDRLSSDRIDYKIALGWSTACVLIEGDVTCFNDPEEPVTPSFDERVVDLSVTSYVRCAIVGEDRTVTCWGSSGESSTLSGSGYFDIAAGGYHSCGINESGVSCAGANWNGETDVPGLLKPKQVAVGSNHSCALDHSGVTCWGLNEDGQTDVPNLVNPKFFAAGENHSCAVDDTGVVLSLIHI